jgi:C4-dicarboxylate-specific signal transduction histidine kinase
VLIGCALFEEGGNQGVAFVLDLTERKRAEAEARDSERRYREVQAELAHGNRVAAMGQLTASIAHEMRQPLSAVKTNGNTALRWLARQPPEIDEARQSIESIVNDANRANDTKLRTHMLSK